VPKLALVNLTKKRLEALFAEAYLNRIVGAKSSPLYHKLSSYREFAGTYGKVVYFKVPN
jgi:hypothetical protein